MTRERLILAVITSVLCFGQISLLFAEQEARGNYRQLSGKGALGTMILATASKYGVDPDLVAAVISVESDFDPLAISSKGAQGLMQLMPGTASRYGVSNPLNPRENVSGGVRYLRDLLLRFDNLLHALAAYNAGENAIRRYSGIPPYRETQNYVKRVISRYRPGQISLPSASALSLGQRANDSQRISRGGRMFIRRSVGGSASPTNQDVSHVHRPVIEITRGPMIRLSEPPRMSVELPAFTR